MSQENVKVVHKCFDAWNRRDLDAWLAGWDERCNYQPAMEQAMAGEEDSYHGHDGLRRWWQEMSDAWSYLQSEVHEVRAVGDHVFVALTFRGKGRASGVEMHSQFFQAGTIREGKVVSCRDYAAREAAVKAVGLAE